MWFFNSTEHYFEFDNSRESFLARYCLNLKKNFLYKKNVYLIAHNQWMIDQFKLKHPQLKKKFTLLSIIQ